MCALLSLGGGAAPELTLAGADALCVTRGRLTAAAGQLRVDEPKMRAVVPASDGDRAELRFVYRGPTAATALLGSGALRRQLGIKLRAQDGCNLIYVMWRLEPVPGIVVSVKRNPGQRTHAECANRGYRNLRGVASATPAVVVAGAPRRLAASLTGRELEVRVDGALVWQGQLDADTAALAGPAGVRSDNVSAEFELRVGRRAGSAVGAAACHGTVDEE